MVAVTLTDGRNSETTEIPWPLNDVMYLTAIDFGHPLGIWPDQVVELASETYKFNRIKGQNVYVLDEGWSSED